MLRTARLVAFCFALVNFVAASTQPSATQSAPSPAFTYNSTTFLLHGSPFQIIGGQMDPQRIPPEYWRDRLTKARAMGLNTIFSYVFWDSLEPTPGVWTSSKPENNIAEYFRIAQEVGLYIVLRPGPYICGEHDFGGFPAWLTQVPGLVVRDYNEPYLTATKSYMERLAGDVAGLQVTKGGPILMVQVENEYGSFGENHQYIAALRDILKQHFEVPLYTNDGGVDFTLEGGSIPGALAEIDGGPTYGFPARNQYITDHSELGPLLDGEYYTWAPDQWGTYNPHNTTETDPAIVEGFISDIDFVLGESKASISFYMVHGGTNFGFDNGALWQNRTTVFTTSYDYGSPIDESGRTNDLYSKMRAALIKYSPNGSIPEPPKNLPRMAVPGFKLSPLTSLFDSLGKPVERDSPVTMEALGQSYGFVLYEHTANASSSGVVKPGDRARDRVQVFVNGMAMGVIDSQYQHPRNIGVSLKAGDKLQLLVENLGRVDYYSRGNPYEDYLRQPEKGIKGDVSVGNRTLMGWKSYPIPLDKIPSGNADLSTVQHGQTPMFYGGTFMAAPFQKTGGQALLDTFLAIPNGIKGQVFVNGFNVGRYWLVGPQQSLYLPGTVVKLNEPNEVIILELEPHLVSNDMTAVGLAEREWGNHPDPDCSYCV